MEKRVRIYMNEVKYYQAVVLFNSQNQFMGVRVHGDIFKNDDTLSSLHPYHSIVTTDEDTRRLLEAQGFRASKFSPSPNCESLHVSISPVNANNVFQEAIRRNMSKSSLLDEILNDRYGESNSRNIRIPLYAVAN